MTHLLGAILRLERYIVPATVQCVGKKSKHSPAGIMKTVKTVTPLCELCVHLELEPIL